MKKESRNKKIILIFTASIIFVAAILFLNKGISVQKSNIVNEGRNAEIKKDKYFTSSDGGNIEVGVVFKNPITKNNENLEFQVELNTHSVDLSEYKELNKFVSLEINDRTIIDKGFVWESDSEGGHHISGILKIKNTYNGKPILNNETKSVKLIFKNIGGVETRQHVYQSNTLK